MFKLCPSALFELLLDRFQQIMLSLLACRMFLRLCELGNRTVHGDGFLDFSLALTPYANTLVHEPGPAAAIRTTLTVSNLNPEHPSEGRLGIYT